MVRSAKHYVFTLNNYTPAELEAARDFRRFCSYLVFGRELGETGTPHLQGSFSCIERRTLGWCRARLGGRAHLELRQGSARQASDYCKKDGDFDEYGVLPGGVGRRSDIEDYRNWLHSLDERPSELEIADNYSSLWFRYPASCDRLAHLLCPAPVLEDGEPWLWQQDVINRVRGECDDNRSVYFYVDTEGNTGKSWLMRKLLSLFPERVQVLGLGKREDLAYAVEERRDIFVFDIPRGSMEYINYGFMEKLKDRVVFSSKYKSVQKVWKKSPHVIVFCNEEPDMEKMTLDRYIIRREFQV